MSTFKVRKVFLQPDEILYVYNSNAPAAEAVSVRFAKDGAMLAVVRAGVESTVVFEDDLEEN